MEQIGTRKTSPTFRKFIPSSYDTCAKPKSAGLKSAPKSQKRRADLPEPELFVDRISPPPSKKSITAVTPLRISKVGHVIHFDCIKM